MKVTKNMGCKHAPRRATRFGQIVAAAVLIGVSITTASAVVVTGPSSTLLVDGKDLGSSVTLYFSNYSTYTSTYDFGYVTGSTFNQFAPVLGTIPSYTFSGGTVMDFAVRKKSSGTVYDMANAAGYATQTYSNAIVLTSSVNPVVTSPYYDTLALVWDLDHNGSTEAGITIKSCVALFGCTTTDGMMAKTVAAPVPLPAALPLFMTGASLLAGLSFRRKRASTV
jgi:hypothetical protein